MASAKDAGVKPTKQTKLEKRKDEAEALAIAYRSSAMRDFLMRARNAGYLPEGSTDDLSSATDTEKFTAVMAGRADGATAAEVEKSLILRDFMISSSGMPVVEVVTPDVDATFNEAAEAAPAAEEKNAQPDTEPERPAPRTPVTTTTGR